MRILLFLVFACAALAQPVSFGVKGGANLTAWFTTEGWRNSYADQSGRYTVGPMVEVRLPCCLRLEVDALYRHYGSAFAGGIAGVYFYSQSSKAATWEFPALAKYSLRREGSLRPFIGVGPVYRWVGQQHVAYTCTGSLCGSAAGTQTSTLPGFASLGFVVGAGAEWKNLQPRLSADIRYSRFERDQGDMDGGSQIRTNQNQLVLLFGVTF